MSLSLSLKHASSWTVGDTDRNRQQCCLNVTKTGKFSWVKKEQKREEHIEERPDTHINGSPLITERNKS